MNTMTARHTTALVALAAFILALLPVLPAGAANSNFGEDVDPWWWQYAEPWSDIPWPYVPCYTDSAEAEAFFGTSTPWCGEWRYREIYASYAELHDPGARPPTGIWREDLIAVQVQWRDMQNGARASLAHRWGQGTRDFHYVGECEGGEGVLCTFETIVQSGDQLEFIYTYCGPGNPVGTDCELPVRGFWVISFDLSLYENPDHPGVPPGPIPPQPDWWYEEDWGPGWDDGLNPPPDGDEDGPPLPDSTFIDVPVGHTFYNNVEWLADSGITRGCNPPDNTRFCPDDHVTRGQMAAFLNRALDLDPSSRTFTDTGKHTFQADISALAQAGITRGCNPPDNTRFCPDDYVTRGQMAAFLNRALDLDPSSRTFTDTDGHTFAGDISALAEAGITRGCNPPDNTRFCPDEFVTRGQMAAFLARSELAS